MAACPLLHTQQALQLPQGRFCFPAILTYASTILCYVLGIAISSLPIRVGPWEATTISSWDQGLNLLVRERKLIVHSKIILPVEFVCLLLGSKFCILLFLLNIVTVQQSLSLQSLALSSLFRACYIGCLGQEEHLITGLDLGFYTLCSRLPTWLLAALLFTNIGREHISISSFCFKMICFPLCYAVTML